MQKIRTPRWLDSTRSWSGRTASDLVYRLVWTDPSCIRALTYPIDNPDLSTFCTIGIMIVDFDPTMKEGPPLV